MTERTPDRTQNDVEAKLAEFYCENGLGFDSGDIMCLGDQRVEIRATRYVEALLCFSLADGLSPLTEFLLIAPPSDRGSLETVASRLNSIGALTQRRTAASVDRGDWFRVVITADHRVTSLFEVIETIPDTSAIIILNASTFRNDKVTIPHQAYVREDLWAPEVHEMCRALLAQTEGKQQYVLLDTGTFEPRRPSNVKLLTAFDNVGVFSVSVGMNSEVLLAENIDRWSALLKAGGLATVVNEIRSSDLDAEDKAFIEIQIYHRANLHGQVLEQIGQFPLTAELPGIAFVKLAQLAADAGARFLSAKHLRRGLQDLDDIDGLSLATEVARSIGYEDLQEAIAERLHKLLPSDTGARELTLRHKLRRGDFAAAVQVSMNLPGHPTELFQAVEKRLQTVDVPDFVTSYSKLAGQFPGDADYLGWLVAGEARRRGQLKLALDVLDTHGSYTSPIARLAVGIIEELALQRHGSRQGNLRQMRDTAGKILKFLAANPLESTVRVHLSEALGLDVSGPEGGAILADIILDLMGRPARYILRKRQDGMSLEQLQESKTFTAVMRWLGNRMPIALGNIALPKELVTEPANDLIPPLMRLLEHAVSSINEDSDTNTLLLGLAMVVAINPYTTALNSDLMAIRTAANGLAISGHTQLARDLAEQGLELAGDDPLRNRLAWFSVADIYQRLNNSIESLTALACAVSGNAEVDTDEAWNEMNGLTRIMRNLGHFEVAREAHAKCWEILIASGDAEANADRHAFMLLTIDVGDARQNEGRDEEKLQELTERAAALAHRALENGDNVGPLTMIMAQLLQWRETDKMSPAVKELFERLLAQTTTTIANQARAMSLATPSPQALLQSHLATQDARYAEDSGFDVRTTTVVARNMLSGEVRNDAVTASFGIELLSDRAVPAPGWSITSAPVAKLASVESASELASRLACNGVSVLQLGISSDNRLVGVKWQDGNGSAWVEDAAVFSTEEYRGWLNDFPFLYGIDETTPNLFYTSTEKLKLSTLPTEPFIVIADADLQPFPVNLLRTANDFIGSVRSVAASPSLSWLAEARSNPLQTNGRMHAWISAEERTGQALVMVIDRLSGTFEQHGISLDTGAEIPAGLEESELVIVTAHGGLGLDDMFFQRVSDEGSLVTSGKRLASSLRNVGVVVLFVCSGGRADKSPEAAATLGLARSLLAEGCAAVVASPWPLDSRVTYHWLPEFLRSWTSGKTIMEANYEANQAVERGLGDELWKTLAMTVYGDPLRTFGNR